MSEQWKKICFVKDIPMLGARIVQRGLAWQELPNVAVFRTAEDKIFALLDRCPHKGGPLSQGIVFGDKVACPLHNWNIELGSGCTTARTVLRQEFDRMRSWCLDESADMNLPLVGQGVVCHVILVACPLVKHLSIGQCTYRRCNPSHRPGRSFQRRGPQNG